MVFIKKNNSIFKIALSIFIFFFLLMTNVSAEAESDDSTGGDSSELYIRCDYGYGYVVEYKNGGVGGSIPNKNRTASFDGMSLKSFEKITGGYYCPLAVYYTVVVSGYSASEHLQFGENKKFNSLKLSNETIILPTTPPDPTEDSYKTCLYGSGGSISISYNSSNVKVDVAGSNDTIITDMTSKSLETGCPPEVYTVSGGGYYRVAMTKTEGTSAVKRYNPSDSYQEVCRFGDNKITSIYGNNTGDYYVETNFPCDTNNFDNAEMKNGCAINLYYKIEKAGNKDICYFTFEEKEGYSNVTSAFVSTPINCDDFITNDGVNIISELFNIIMIIGPILALVLGGIDFAKATLASDENALKKAGTNFGKRIVAAILLFLLPLIINLILSIAFDAGVFEDSKEVPSVCLIKK